MMSKLISKLNRTLFRTKPQPYLNQKPHPNDIAHDYIGPPDANSNLRPIVRHSLAGFERTESDTAYSLRTRRLEVERWNQEFWTKHNKRFIEEKEDFINTHNLTSTAAPSADDMSVFYKEFLDKNWRIHFFYNMSWYAKNAELLMLAAQVNAQRFLASKRN